MVIERIGRLRIRAEFGLKALKKANERTGEDEREGTSTARRRKKAEKRKCKEDLKNERMKVGTRHWPPLVPLAEFQIYL